MIGLPCEGCLLCYCRLSLYRTIWEIIKIDNVASEIANIARREYCLLEFLSKHVGDSAPSLFMLLICSDYYIKINGRGV